MATDSFAVGVDGVGFGGRELFKPFGEGVLHSFEEVVGPLRAVLVLRGIHE